MQIQQLGTDGRSPLVSLDFLHDAVDLVGIVFQIRQRFLRGLDVHQQQRAGFLGFVHSGTGGLKFPGFFQVPQVSQMFGANRGSVGFTGGVIVVDNNDFTHSSILGTCHAQRKPARIVRNSRGH